MLTLGRHRLIVVHTDTLKRTLLQIALSSQVQSIGLTAQRRDAVVLELHLVWNHDSLLNVCDSSILCLDLRNINVGKGCFATIQVERAIEGVQGRMEF